MSSKEDGDRSALETSRHVQDVSRAWDSLLEAKHVLQRIENKVDIQNRPRNQAHKVRRRLQLERSSFSDPDSCSSKINDSSLEKRVQTYEGRPDETFTLYSQANVSSKMDIPLDSLSRPRPPTFMEEDNPYVLSLHQHHMGSTPENILSKSSLENFNNDQVMAFRGFSEELESLRTYRPEQMNELINPFLAVTYLSPETYERPQIDPCLSPEAIAPSPKDDLYMQKLEHLKRKSPKSKLEKLKERIQEQKRRQNLSKRNPLKSRENPELLRKSTMKRKVCKVTFGPPSLYYKEEESVPLYSEEGAIKREKENLEKKSYKDEGDSAFRYSAGKSRALKSKSPVIRKMPIRSPSLEQKVKQSGLYGASAWREGQRLVHQILGPSPVKLLKHRSPKADETLHTLQKGSCRKCQKLGTPHNLKHKCPQVLRSSTNELQNPILDCAQVIPEINAGEHRLRPAGKISGKDGERTRDSNRSKSSSPTRPDITLERRPCGKENAGDNLESHTNSGNRRNYSVAQIRDFMKKKAMERQMTARENQTKMGKAAQMRKEQLDNVIKKQKEAFPPKKGGRNSVVSWKTTQQQPGEVPDVRKNLSEWLHVTCDDLLRDYDGASRNPEKQKTETLSKENYSRPLRLQDLARGGNGSQEVQVEDIDSYKRPNDDALPSHAIHQERLHAIWTTAKDLGRRVELECNRLGSPNLGMTTVSSRSPDSPPQMALASDIDHIADRSEKNFQVNTRDPPEDEERTRSVDTDLCWSPERAKVSTEKTRHRANEESPTKKFHAKVHREKAQKSRLSHRSASTSLPSASDVSSPKLLRKTSVSPPRRKTLSPRKATSSSYSDKGKQGKPHYGESSSADMHLEIASKIKAQLQQQEKDLAALRLKAKVEAKEAQRCLEEMLRCNNQQSPELKSSSPEKRRNRISSRGQERENDWFGAGWEPCVESGKSGAGNVTQQNGPIRAHMSAAPTETESLEQSWDHTDSTSKWSEVGEFYGSPNMFTHFTLEMSQQYLREEELRARHQTALLRLREEALKEKTKAELALLHHQKIYWETKNDLSKVEELLKQEHEIQRNLKQEQAEILHLHNIYKAAHQERKLLLKQQKEILRIQQSAAHIQQKLHKSGVTLEVSELDLSTQQSKYIPLRDSILASEPMNQDTQSAISDLSEDDDIAEKPETYPAQEAEDESTSPVPEVCDLQRPEAAEEKAIYNPDINHDGARRERNQCNVSLCSADGTAEGDSSSGDGTRVTGSLQNNPCQSQEELSNHFTEEIVSGNKNDEDTFVHREDADRDTAEEPRNKLSLKDKDNVENSEKLTQDLKIIPTAQPTASDDHMVTEPIHDHSSRRISALSKSENVALSPSFAEFQKVSAKLINISESSISASDRGKGSEDTESGDSEVFDMESSEFPPGGPSDKEWGGNMINPDGEYVKEGDKSKSSPVERPDSRKLVVVILKETEMSKMEMAPLAFESFPTSEDLTESDTKTYGVNDLPDNQDVSIVRITEIHKSTSMSPKADGNVAGMSSPDTKDQQRVTQTNEKQSLTESAICRKIEMMPSDATTSKDLFQIKSFPHRSEGDIIFITDEVLQPDEDTLSEIFSPLDEKLSYDLYQSEELPSLPRDQSSITSGDSNTEDFPTPPEEMLLSEHESLQSSREASLIEEIHLLYDSLMTEDILLPPEETIDTGDSPLDISRTSKVVKPCRPFLTLSKANDAIHDPLSTFGIGDRVLVKPSKTGTLRYKGLMSFKAGYWAGVALDEPEGDNDGTYEGIRYFDCLKDYGVFVRPGQISHLLFDDADGSDTQKDKDDDNSFGEGDAQPSGGSRRQVRERDDRKPSEKDANQNQSRSCSLESSENINDLQDVDLSLRCLHPHPKEENKNRARALRIKPFCGGDTNKLLAPNPPQDDKHRLLLKVKDKLISLVLCDATGTSSKISAPEKASVMNSRKGEDEKCAVVEEGFCNQLPAMTPRAAGGCVDAAVTDDRNDCIKEYKKIRKKKDEENIYWPSITYSSQTLAAGKRHTSTSLCGHRTSSLMNFIDGIFEDLMKESLLVIGDTTFTRTH
ncbi:coiled-coil domain-containing protein 187 isoform X3 [Phyllobates terribilis]|uniref:coiled-coil domain-containing protein 187 isoform X3 n=1 Tax=Phyllobates terribilis TaxID=111132 RepID=UPI003CCAEA2F